MTGSNIFIPTFLYDRREEVPSSQQSDGQLDKKEMMRRTRDQISRISNSTDGKEGRKEECFEIETLLKL